jgi:hypothetical protein
VPGLAVSGMIRKLTVQFLGGDGLQGSGFLGSVAGSKMFRFAVNFHSCAVPSASETFYTFVAGGVVGVLAPVGS